MVTTTAEKTNNQERYEWPWGAVCGHIDGKGGSYSNRTECPKPKRSEPTAQSGPKVRATFARRKKKGIGNVPHLAESRRDQHVYEYGRRSQGGRCVSVNGNHKGRCRTKGRVRHPWHRRRSPRHPGIQCELEFSNDPTG